jgi:hypothetical protein
LVLERARAKHLSRAASEDGVGHDGADFDKPAAWAGLDGTGTALSVYGDHHLVEEGPRYSLKSVARVTLTYTSVRHVRVHVLPRLRRMGALRALSLLECGVGSLADLYALLPALPQLHELKISDAESASNESAAPASVTRHPHFRLCAISLLPQLRVLNGLAVTDTERRDAETRCAALARCALSPRSPDQTRPAHGASQPGADGSQRARASTELTTSAFVGSVVQHALVIDAKLRAVNATWPSVVATYVEEAAAQLDGGGAQAPRTASNGLQS